MTAPRGRASRLRKAPNFARVTAASGALHGLVLAALFWRPPLLPVAPPTTPATIQVEYVNQAAAMRGAPPTDATDPGAAPTPPAPPPDPAAETPLPPAGAPAPVSASLPHVNLGDADEDRDALNVTGDNVVSSGPDARYRNLPPPYPAEAVRRHEEGTVEVLVHVTPKGEAGEIEMTSSSGSAALDNAVLAAVAKWHFTPALDHGAPVASVYPLAMNFRNNE